MKLQLPDSTDLFVHVSADHPAYDAGLLERYNATKNAIQEMKRCLTVYQEAFSGRWNTKVVPEKYLEGEWVFETACLKLQLAVAVLENALPALIAWVKEVKNSRRQEFFASKSLENRIAISNVLAAEVAYDTGCSLYIEYTRVSSPALSDLEQAYQCLNPGSDRKYFLKIGANCTKPRFDGPDPFCPTASFRMTRAEAEAYAEELEETGVDVEICYLD